MLQQIEIARVVDALVGSRIRKYLHGTDTVSHSEADRRDLERSIDSIYLAAGLEKPLTVYCESPFQLSAATLFSKLLLCDDYVIQDRLKQVVRRYEKDRLVRGVVEAVERAVDVDSVQPFRLGRTIEFQLLERVSQVARQYRKVLPFEDFQDQLLNLGSFLAAAIDVHVLWVGLTRSGPSKAAMKFRSELINLKTAMPIPSWPEELDEPIGSDTDAWGPWSSSNEHMVRLNERSQSVSWSTLVLCEAIAEVLGLKNEELKSWTTLLQYGFCYQFFKQICFVCLPPVSYNLDQFLRLHSETGPAVEFADGSHIYSYHGTPVPERVIEGRKMISPLTIELEPNIEIRRVLLEMYGLEKYLRKAQAKRIHQDEYGVLYRKNFLNDEPLVVVEVTNSTPEPDGSRRKYLLRVPPDTMTAREGVAWTFGMREGDYKPSAES